MIYQSFSSCQVAPTTAKAEDAEPSPHDQPAGDTKPLDPPKKEKVKRLRSVSEYDQYPDRCPSFATTSDEEDEDDENGERPFALHEDLHEELYGLPTPSKNDGDAEEPGTPASSKITPTELEDTPEPQIISDEEKPPGHGDAVDDATAGTYKDCIFYTYPWIH